MMLYVPWSPWRWRWASVHCFTTRINGCCIRSACRRRLAVVVTVIEPAVVNAWHSELSEQHHRHIGKQFVMILARPAGPYTDVASERSALKRARACSEVADSCTTSLSVVHTIRATHNTWRSDDLPA